MPNYGRKSEQPQQETPSTNSLNNVICTAASVAACMIAFGAHQNTCVQTELQQRQLELAQRLYDEAHEPPRVSFINTMPGDAN